eukprot:GSMAST32.ASY1.ANO1.45.1 assembled CDS
MTAMNFKRISISHHSQIGTQSQQKNKTFPLFFHLTPKMSLATTYVKVFAGTFGLYGLQMLFTPAKMVTDHFETPATPMLKFWIRGQSVSLLALCYSMTLLPPAVAVKIGAASSLAVGLLYPWNAKFNFLGDKLPVKYPMHYVPEVLMLALSAWGGYLVATNAQ